MMKNFIKYYRKSIFMITVLIFSFFNLLLAEMELIILTKDAPPGRKTRINFVWNGIEDIEGINIYRKTSPLEKYSRNPINEVPVKLMEDCEAIGDIIVRGSDEWQILSSLPWEQTRPLKGDGLFRDPGYPIRPAGFNPCVLATLDSASELWDEIQFLSLRFHNISLVLGQAYVDSDVIAGTTYFYEFRALSEGSETLLKATGPILAGTSIPLPSPANLQVTAGDSQVLITWDEVENAFGYNVYRRVVPHGTAVKINYAPVMAVITQDLEGNPISDTMGFIDFRRWDETGMPLTHDVDGSPVAGPSNGIHYQYQVVALDGLEQPGNPSGFSATVLPEDTTPPGLPGDLSVKAVGQTLKITWSKVTKDKYGRIEMDGISGYNIYRSESQNSPVQQKLNLALIPQPAGTEVEIIDSDPAIISHYGEKEFYYRIDCTDVHGNKGEKSSTASGFVPDIYPPDPPENTSAEGYQEFIRSFWDLNKEPDIYSYEIYRSLCHLGEWLDPREQERKEITSGDFVLVGEITHQEAAELAAGTGQPYWDDYTVPTESPLCYAYWIKARDESQNLSGNWPYPSLDEKKLIVCQRLRDETPPPPPIITAIQARDEAIYLEWIAAPSQDLGVFHIYRSLEEETDYTWIGGITVEEPPTPPVDLSEPFAPASPCSCDIIPLVAHEGMNAGFFYDKKVDPKTVYYYKVLSVDQNGNESSINEAIPYSSFTFKFSGPSQPQITSIENLSDDCGLDIRWIPQFQAAIHLGYIVFRSSSETGIFRQISPLLNTSQYTDKTVNKGINYWYKIQSLDLEGRPSLLSNSYQAKYE
jgi:hypothetical protein